MSMERLGRLVLMSTLVLSGASVLRTDAYATSNRSRLCAPSDLQISFHGFLDGMGNVNNLFWVRNTSTESCRLTGFPTAAFLGPHGTRLSVVQDDVVDRDFNDIGGLKKGTEMPAVTLKSDGGLASFMIYGTDMPFGNPPSKCISTRTMSVTLPRVKGAYRVFIRLGGFHFCGQITMHPLVPGGTGADPPIAQIPG
jgi:hypothetical protein